MVPFAFFVVSSASFVWILTTVPLFTNKLATSTDCVKKPPGLSRMSRTNESAPCDSRSEIALLTKLDAFWVTCLSWM